MPAPDRLAIPLLTRPAERLMDYVEPFTRGMIQRYLKARDIPFLTDEDGDCRVDIHDPATGRELTIWFEAAGVHADVYSILALSNLAIPSSDFGRALLACNAWNEQKRWPRAWLQRPEDGGASGQIILGYSLLLDHGVHQALVDSVSDAVQFGADDFWTWLSAEHGF